jgi:hypothetical protein
MRRKRSGLARNTVKKYLSSEEIEPAYPRRVSAKKLDSYAEKPTGWLELDATKSRKQRRNLKQIYTKGGSQMPQGGERHEDRKTAGTREFQTLPHAGSRL